MKLSKQKEILETQGKLLTKKEEKISEEVHESPIK